MKPSIFLAGAIALIAVAGCNSEQGGATTNAPVKLEQVAPPKGGDWSQVVNPTPEGGFMMGNPNAKVKLVEFGSMTCPHCAEFDETGVQPLIDKYVKSGQVSWEFRNYVRDGVDIAASLIARCNGGKQFFPLTRALYKDQDSWFAKLQSAPQEQMQQLQNLPPARQFVEVAKVAGFQSWAAARGVPEAKANACLANEGSINQLVQMASDATTQFPEFQGTPSFVINGELLKDVANWQALEPKLREALGS